jgi:tRNA threonylcarbamoyl adenosine modification protein (Sua5/YciO/YrdC/YwlC family)
MKIKTIFWGSSAVLQKIDTIIQKNQVVVCATDTVLGLLSNISEQSFWALNKIKCREGKPYLVLIGGIDQLGRFVDSEQLFLIENFVRDKWPAPLTVICKAKKGIPHWLTSTEGAIALRIPNHAKLRKLAYQAGGLFSTSANRAGESIPTRIRDIPQAILDMVNLVVLEEGKEEYSVVPSTIVDYTSGQAKIIRQGVYQL